MAGSCRVFLLGGFRVELDDHPLPPAAWRHRRGADLVKLLALAPDHRLHRERIIEALWPGLRPEAGAANLRKALHFARGALGGPGSIRAESEMLQLWPGGELEVDADLFAGAPQEAAVDLYAGDLLPEDEYEPWSGEARERLRHRFLEALRASGRWERAVELDPLDEASYRELMRADLAAGNRQGAMRRFEQLREALHEEVGVGPDPETVGLYEEILAAEGTEPATPEERARAHLAAGLVALNRQELAAAEREATSARALAIEAGLGRELGEASGLLGMVAHMKGTWREVFGETLAVLEQVPSLAEHVLDANLCLAEFWLYGADGGEDARELARELLTAAEKTDSLPAKALATLILGENEAVSGRLEDAEEHLGRAVELYSEGGTSSALALAIERLAEVAIAEGDRERAEALLDEAHSLARVVPLASHMLVRVHGARIQAGSSGKNAMTAVLKAEAELEGREVCDPCSMGYLAAAAMAAARAGEPQTARRYLSDAERVSGLWQGGASAAAVWEARAELRLAEREPRQAAALFREAAAGFSRAGHTLADARCRAAAESAERATG